MYGHTTGEILSFNKAEYDKAYQKKYPERLKLANLRSDLKKLGCTIEMFNQMFADQGGYCKICGLHQSLFKKRLHVDHCHATKRVRQLLCCNCNHLLGKAKDSVEILKSAIKYLEEHNC